MVELMVVLLAVAALAVIVVVGGVIVVMGIVFHLIAGLIVLPFRLLGWFLWLPLLILKAVLGAVFGLAFGLLSAVMAVPLVLLGLLFGGVALAAGVLVPLLPLIAIGLIVWLLARLSARPAAL